MVWQHPEALYLILPLCAAWLVLALYSDRARHRARETFAAKPMWPRVLPEESRLRFWIKLGFREIAMIAGLVALAGPKFGMQYEQVVPRGSDLYVLIDVSRSMLATDVPPSRLGRAKADVASLVNRLEGERIGLIAFAGQAVVKCPLTVDYDSFRRALDELDPDSAPRGGTSIGDAIRKALEVFHAKADRDQAILLITDGDDQESYPLEAAAVAAERHVTIFTVGLGDAEQGARVPQKSDAKTYTTYEGQQVWSKLDSNLLQQIALKTSGVYVPAGTRAYDLGELYSNHLHGRRGNEAESQQRIRHSERFQIFLAISLAALLIDLCIVSCRRSPQLGRIDQTRSQKGTASENGAKPRSRMISTSSLIGFFVLNCVGQMSFAAEPSAPVTSKPEADPAKVPAKPSVSVRDGLRLYSNEKYDEAKDKFAAAAEELDKQKSAAVAIAAFDEACAAHRNGDLDHARDSYLRAGLSQDKAVALAAHFNLGTLSAEKARTLCGEHPELVAPEKRQEILDQLSQATTAYRHCLELRKDHVSSRRNLELVRQWVKYYTDQWRERDRQKRRDESNLLVFLEFLIQAQSTLKETVVQLPPTVHADELAELKRVQEELREEIPTLREKIEKELRPTPDPTAKSVPPVAKELEEGISMLQGFADTAGSRMASAATRLGARLPEKAVIEQQEVLDELDKIWEAIIPFHPLLNKLLADQTALVKELSPAKSEDEKKPDQHDDGLTPLENDEDPKPAVIPNDHKSIMTLESSGDELKKFENAESKVLKRSRLIAPKADAELQQLESAPAVAPDKQDDHGEPQSTKVDPEQAKAGFRKAIELGPQAVEQLDATVKSLRQQNRQAAASSAEEARRILEEIQKAQPEKKQDPQNQDQQNQDQQKNQNQKQQQDQKDGDDKKDDPQKKEDQKQKDEKKKDDKESKDSQQKQPQQKQQAQVSQDRVEDALRKVRERQQEKRERDRKLKGQFLGKVPVDKDW